MFFFHRAAPVNKERFLKCIADWKLFFRIYGDEYSEMTINFTVKAPTLHIYGKYNVNGQLLILELDGEGDISANLSKHRKNPWKQAQYAPSRLKSMP